MFTASSVVWEFAIRSHESGNMTLPPWKSAPTLERFPRSNFGDLALHRSLGVVLAALSLTVAHAAPIDGEPPAARGALSLRDDFEGGKLAAFWLPGNYGTGSHVSGAVVLTAEHAHRGRKSCRITVREGDVEALGDDGKKVERAELDSGHLPLLGRDVYYGFAFLLPKDFPVVDNRLVIGSIKQSDVEGSPLLGQRFQAGRHMLSIRRVGRDGLPGAVLGRPERSDRAVDGWDESRDVQGPDGLAEGGESVLSQSGTLPGPLEGADDDVPGRLRSR
jgi:hypothetical protein